MGDLSPDMAGEVFNALTSNGVVLALFQQGAELDVEGYSRQAVTFTRPLVGAGNNTTPVTFGPLQGNGAVTHAALFDNDDRPLTTPRQLLRPITWQPGDLIRFEPGAVSLAL